MVFLHLQVKSSTAFQGEVGTGFIHGKYRFNLVMIITLGFEQMSNAILKKVKRRRFLLMFLSSPIWLLFGVAGDDFTRANIAEFRTRGTTGPQPPSGACDANLAVCLRMRRLDERSCWTRKTRLYTATSDAPGSGR